MFNLVDQQLHTAAGNGLRRLLTVLAMTSSVFLASCSIESQPVNQPEQIQIIEDDLKSIFDDQEVVNSQINIYEAMARALKYNRDHKLQMMEAVLQSSQLTASKINLLPTLTAEAGYHYRDNEPGASSRSLLTGTQSLVASSSTERVGHDTSLSVTWNALDFGLSYVTAKQKSDQLLIARERQRKVAHNILRDVRYAYWRAVSAEKLIREISILEDHVYTALQNSKAASKAKLIPKITALQYQKSLLETLKQLKSLRKELSIAKSQLAALINLKPGSNFEIQTPDDAQSLIIPAPPAPLADLENAALLNRPEIKEEIYNTSIGKREIQKAWLETFPGISFDWAQNYDNNQFLFNNSWSELGVRVTGNLLRSLSLPIRKNAAEARVDFADAKRMAVVMAVLTQVHISHVQYQLALDDFKLNDQLTDVNSEIFNQIKNALVSDSGNKQELIQSFSNLLITRMQRDLSYAELQNAVGTLYASIGVDPIMEDVDLMGVHELADLLKQRFSGWESQTIEDVIPDKEYIETPDIEEFEGFLGLKLFDEEPEKVTLIPETATPVAPSAIVPKFPAYVQVATLGVQSNVDHAREQLQQWKDLFIVGDVTLGGKPFSVVKVGPFDDLNNLQEAVTNIRNSGYSDAMVVYAP